MSPILVSAHFAAYIWFTAQPENADKAPAAAMQFAYAKWPRFVKLANPGLGRLLLKMAEVPTAARRRRRVRRVLAAAPYATAGEQPFSCN